MDIHYAVVSHPGGPNFAASASGFATDLNELTAVTSHELAEAVTDPNVNYKASGWFDLQYGKEIADLAYGNYSFLNGWEVYDVVNMQDQVITPSTLQTPPPSGLVAPAVTAVAQSSSSVKLSWTAVAQVEGYRIYRVNGSQLQLINTLSPQTTTFTVYGLPASSTVSFQVEAYRGTAFVRSAIVSATTASAYALAAPKLTVTALKSTTVSLSWNAVTGATGYRIYYLNPSGVKQMLGTVSSSAAWWGKFYVSVSGLTPGSTVQFMIEAYNATQIGDSAWVSLKLPLV